MYNKYLHNPASYMHQEIIFEIQKGESFKEITNNLFEKGLLGHKNAFYFFARATGQTARVKAGEYLLATDMNALEILNIITSGKSFERTVTLSEGLNIFEIAEIFQQKGICSKEEFLKLVRDPKIIEKYLSEKQISLEGYLFPETYAFTRFTSAEQLIEMMIKKFKDVWSELKLPLPNGWTRHKVITLASIVEKETGAPEERPLISSVFHNRMAKGMLLQTDPTILYGMAEEQGKLVLNIRKADILRPTKYNTYVIKGLPPGPIANPGREAILASVKPEQSKYLFFVSMNEGRHAFSETYKEHQEAVRKYQIDRQAREGKSWRQMQDSENPKKK